MYSLTRLRCYVGGGLGVLGGTGSGAGATYRNTAQLAEAFQPVPHRTSSAYDHVIIDVSHFAASLAYLTRDLVGYDRDRETVRNIQRQLQTVVLRRLQPRKSLSLLMDGSEPLWVLEHRRLFPGRRYDAHVYRSSASAMPYLLEEQLRGAVMEQRSAPAEVVVAGPATPGLAEGKISAFLLDLATRMVCRPTRPPPLSTNLVTPRDSICLVGGMDLAWLALGMTPFHNITSMSLQHGELRGCSLADSMRWLRLEQHYQPLAASSETAPPAEGTAVTDAEVVAQQQRTAAIRTDLVFMYLLTNGHSSTGLPPLLACPFADVLDAYVTLESAGHPHGRLMVPTTEMPALTTPPFRSLLFEEAPVIATQREGHTLRLRVTGLQRLLALVIKATGPANMGLPSGTRPTPHAATLLEMALQTHGLLCCGGVPSPAWTPTPDPAASSSAPTPANGTLLLDKFPKLSAEQVYQHLAYLVAQPRAASSSSKSSSPPSAPPPVPAQHEADEVCICPQRSRHFGLTGVETLLLSATQASQIHQLLPLYVRGHTLPEGVAEDIVQTRNIHEALRKTRQVLRRVLDQATRDLASETRRVAAAGSGGDAGDVGDSTPHPALTHLPTHLFVRTNGARGPPPMWAYYGIHLGIKAEAMHVRYSVNMADTATLRVMEVASLLPRDALYVWKGAADDADGIWELMPCSAFPVRVPPAANGATGTTTTEEESTPMTGTLRLMTWNTQFSLHSGEQTPLGREGIDWCTQTRHVAAARVLELAEPDVACLQEVEPAWVSYLAAQPWVRARYALSAWEDSPQLEPHGVLLLVRRDLSRITSMRHAGLPGYRGQLRFIPEVKLQMGLNLDPIVISGVHLLAPYSKVNESSRKEQLRCLEHHLAGREWAEPSALPSASSSTDLKGEFDGRKERVSHVLLGDLNDYPAKPYQLPSPLGFRDAWEVLHPGCLHRSTAPPAERGDTIDGTTNPYTAKIIEPQFYGRPDRILFASRQMQPIAAELIGTAPVTEVLAGPTTAAAGEGTPAAPLQQVDKPGEAIPDYLYPSDHYGVLVEFQLV